jgi:hypothetical protein
MTAGTAMNTAPMAGATRLGEQTPPCCPACGRRKRTAHPARRRRELRRAKRADEQAWRAQLRNARL